MLLQIVPWVEWSKPCFIFLNFFLFLFFIFLHSVSPVPLVLSFEVRLSNLLYRINTTCNLNVGTFVLLL